MNKKFFIGAIFAAAAATATNAFADDAKSYNGSFCQPYNGGQADQFFHYSGGTRNRSTSSVGYVTCPLLQDAVIGESGPPYVFGVRYISFYWRGTGTASCTFYSMDRQGLIAQTVYGSGGPGRVNLPDITRGDIGGSFVFFCRLPPGGTLSKYSVWERS